MARARRLLPNSGFSLPELIAVIVIVTTLAAFATSRLSGTFARTRAAYDELYSQVSYARKEAIAQRRAVFVHIDGSQSMLCYVAGACAGNGAPSPNGSVPFTVQMPSGVSATVADFQFDALGRYLTSVGGTPGARLQIDVAGEGTYTFYVEPETGYVHP